MIGKMERGNFTFEAESSYWRPEQIFREQYNRDAFEKLSNELKTVHLVREGEKLFARQMDIKNTEVEINFSDPSEALMDREQEVYAAFAPSKDVLLNTPEGILEELYARDVYIAIVKSTLRVLNNGNTQNYTRQILDASNDLYTLLKIVRHPVIEYKDLIINPYKKQKPFSSQYSSICQKNTFLPANLDQKILNATYFGTKNAPKTIAPKASNRPKAKPPSNLLNANQDALENQTADLENDTSLVGDFEPINKTEQFLRYFKGKATTANQKINMLSQEVAKGNLESILYVKIGENHWHRGFIGIKAYFEKLAQNNDHDILQLIINNLNKDNSNELEIIKISNMFSEISNRSAQKSSEIIQPLESTLTNMSKAFVRVRYVMQKLGLEKDNKSAEQLGDIVQAILSISMSKSKKLK